MSLDIAREVAARLAESERVNATGWKWQRGIVLFPESRCPFCEGVIRSRAVWLVRGYNLIGQGVPVAGRALKLDPPKHPHATPSAICMGDAVDPLQALFNGLNVKSSYFNPYDEITGGMCPWLRGPYWEHSCSEMREAESRTEDDEDTFVCEGCNELYNYDSSYTHGDSLYCVDCFNESYFYCCQCSETYSNDEQKTYNGEYYCESCFKKDHFECEKCGKAGKLDNAYQAFGDLYCESCYDDRFFTCDECSDVFELKDHKEMSDGTLVCEDCYDPFTCEDCQEEFPGEEKGEGCIYCVKTLLCSDCSENHSEEACG